MNDVDELTSITRARWLTPVKSYTYDDAGRTTSVVSSAGTTSLSYDYEGRLTQITYPSTATNTFTYNALDTRVGKVDSAGTATYKRDGATVVSPVLSEGSEAYTAGISSRKGFSTTYNLGDHLGTIRIQSDSSQSTTSTRQYDAFGNLTALIGVPKGAFGFAGVWGYQEDADSGLKLLGHRYYDSSTGRFITRDPVKDGGNWYAYGHNNPQRMVDPWGLTELDSATHSQSFRVTWQLIREGNAPPGVLREWERQFGNVLRELGLKITNHGWERLLLRFPDIGRFLWLLRNGRVYRNGAEIWIIAGGKGVVVDESGSIITVVDNASAKGKVFVEAASDFFRRLTGQ